MGMFFHNADEVPERPADPAKRRSNLRRIRHLFASYKLRLGGLLGLIVFSAALGVLPAFLLKRVLEAIGANDTRSLSLNSAAIIAIAIAVGVLGVIQTLLSNQVGQRVMSAMLNPMVQYSPAIDRAFAALGDPTRRAVLERLGSGSATITELAEPFGMSLTGMKKHIRLLEEAELVTTEKIGRVRRCTLVPYAFEGISTWLQRLDRFAQVVERTKGAR